jgi:hypothetical protein
MSGKSHLRSLMESTERFFFAEESPYGLALVRMCLPTVALIPMVRRFFRVRELYSADGCPQQLAELFGNGRLLPELPGPVAAALYGLMLFALICGVFGFRTRLSFLIGGLLYIYFNMLDAIGTMTKYSVIASHVLLILAISNAGAVWSVDAVLRRRKRTDGTAAFPVRVPVWPARLIQILFAAIYFGAAITKVQTPEFFSGEQMRYWLVSNWNWPNPIGEMMALSPALLMISSYITVVWEVTFPFLAWRPLGRYAALGIGAAFHIMTIFSLGLWIFPFICTTCYLAFLQEGDIAAIRILLRRLRLQFHWAGVPRILAASLLERRPAMVPLAGIWAVAGIVVVVGSVEADYRLDVYGIRRHGAPMALPSLDTTLARQMINSRPTLREKDKYFSFDIGSMVMAGQLANRRSEFETGDVIIAQCNLNPPHEDLWVECVIQDEQDRVIDVAGQFVTRDQLFAKFSYLTADKLIPGRYWVVLKSSGQEVSRRPFELSGDAAVERPEDGTLAN